MIMTYEKGNSSESDIAHSRIHPADHPTNQYEQSGTIS
jgi:hypothetical protein